MEADPALASRPTRRPDELGGIRYDAVDRSGSNHRVHGAATATLIDPSGTGGTFTYAMPFTTETAATTNLVGYRSLSVSGMRLVEGAWYAQIVGATVNKENAFPKPGTAVYTVLSRAFDPLPAMP